MAQLCNISQNKYVSSVILCQNPHHITPESWLYSILLFNKQKQNNKMDGCKSDPIVVDNTT